MTDGGDHAMNPSDDAHKLFVAGLPESITEEALRDLFDGSGIQVVDVSLPRDRMTGRPRGFAFVRLSGPEDVDRALSLLDGHMLGGVSISVRRFKSEPPVRGERPVGGPPSGGRGPAVDTSDRTLYVGNLPYDATQEELETLLREAGADSVVRVHMPVDPDGRRRGFGFVTLASAESARTTVEQLKGAALRGRSLVVNLALPKSAPGGGGGAPRGGPRSFGPPGPSMGPGGGAPSGAPANRFGPPAKPAGARDFTKRKKTEGDGGPGGRGRGGSRRDNEANWRVDDDD